MKKVITELTKESVIVTVTANNDVCVLQFPVDMIAPQISLQVAGMISSDPTIPRKNENTTAE